VISVLLRSEPRGILRELGGLAERSGELAKDAGGLGQGC